MHREFLAELWFGASATTGLSIGDPVRGTCMFSVVKDTNQVRIFFQCYCSVIRRVFYNGQVVFLWCKGEGSVICPFSVEALNQVTLLNVDVGMDNVRAPILGLCELQCAQAWNFKNMVTRILRLQFPGLPRPSIYCFAR